jgi:hypothetical protein
MNPFELESGGGAASKPNDSAASQKPLGSAIIGSISLKIACLAIVAACTGAFFLVGNKLRVGVEDSRQVTQTQLNLVSYS